MMPKIIQSPATWHTHEDKPDNWFESIKEELERIEKTPHHLLGRPQIYSVIVK